MTINLALGTLAAGVALFGSLHLQLTDSRPEVDSSIDESPAEIRVWFNQQPRLSLSRLALEGPNGEVELGDVEAAEGMSFKSGLDVTLVPGAYTVRWRTAGDDGHVRRGSFTFTMTAQEGY